MHQLMLHLPATVSTVVVEQLPSEFRGLVIKMKAASEVLANAVVAPEVGRLSFRTLEAALECARSIIDLALAEIGERDERH